MSHLPAYKSALGSDGAFRRVGLRVRVGPHGVLSGPRYVKCGLGDSRGQDFVDPYRANALRIRRVGRNIHSNVVVLELIGDVGEDGIAAGRFAHFPRSGQCQRPFDANARLCPQVEGDFIPIGRLHPCTG